MGLEFFQDDIRWYFESDVGHEKDGKGRVILGARKPQVLLQAENRCIGDVGTVQKGKQIENAQNRDDTQIDPGDQPSLAGMGWTLHSKIIIILGIRAGNVRVVVILTVIFRVIYLGFWRFGHLP